MSERTTYALPENAVVLDQHVDSVHGHRLWAVYGVNLTDQQQVLLYCDTEDPTRIGPRIGVMLRREDVEELLRMFP